MPVTHKGTSLPDSPLFITLDVVPSLPFLICDTGACWSATSRSFALHHACVTKSMQVTHLWSETTHHAASPGPRAVAIRLAFKQRHPHAARWKWHKHPAAADAFGPSSKREWSAVCERWMACMVGLQAFGLEVEQAVHGEGGFLPLEASLSSLGFATFPLIDPSLDV